jgi:hemerythrin
MSHPTLRDVLLDDHRAIAELVNDVSEAARANVDTRTLVAMWSRLTAMIEAHFRIEEQVVLPALAASHPEEVDALMLEHGELRKALDEISTAVQLHQVRADALEAFLHRLAAHAEREDRWIYRWAVHELHGHPGRRSGEATRS